MLQKNSCIFKETIVKIMSNLRISFFDMRFFWKAQSNKYKIV